jgi:glycosyltransferase involved in cell wall biosynthesis
MKKILSLYYRPKPGGFCKRLAMAYEAFAEKGWDVHYLSIEKFPVNHPNIHYHRIPMVFKKREHAVFWLNFLLVAPAALFFIRSQIPADAIIVFGQTYSFLAAPCRLFRKTKIILFSRGELLDSLRDTQRGLLRPIVLAVYGLIRRVGMHISDAVIFNSASKARKAGEEFPLRRERFFVLPNDIPAPRILAKGDARMILKKEFSLKSDPFILISVGRLHPGKNFEFLLKIFHRIQDHLGLDHTCLFIIGDDPLTGSAEKARILEKAASDGLEHVFLPGWRNDLEVFYSAADAFVMTSKHEGSPNSLLEALSYGLPSFGSDIDEIRDILKDDILRFSLDTHGLEKAASAILGTFEDPIFREEVRSLCLTIMKTLTFDWKSEISRMINVALA